MADHVHDENCDHDHEHEDGEIEITINPREDDLGKLGISPEEFETALMKTLDAFDEASEASDPDSVIAIEDAVIVLNGKSYRLQEVADIEISSDDLEFGDDDDDEEDDDDEPKHDKAK